MNLGLIAGTILYGTELFQGARRRRIETPFGRTLVLAADDLVYLPRHGLDEDRYILPHRINHQANLAAFEQLGIKRVVGLNSTGSLRRDLIPGTIVIPDDFISLTDVPTSAVGRALHITPALSESVRQELAQAAARAGVEVVQGGVYWQNPGPRLETKAEVRLISGFADLVGMTMAGEAAIACEMGLEYAALCSIDNFGHGLIEEPLSEEQIREGARLNREKMLAVVRALARS
jgi:5'-methylthioadenosine phosphorylase